MTAEGRLARGKANYDKGKFLDNSETVAYVKTLKEAPKDKPEKPKEAEDARPAK